MALCYLRPVSCSFGLNLLAYKIGYELSIKSLWIFLNGYSFQQDYIQK